MSEEDLNVNPDFRRKVRLIVSETNRGYGAACNIGGRSTDAPVLLFLNDDTHLRDSCIAELYKSISRDESTVFQPIIRHEYARQTRSGNPCDLFGAAGLGFYANCGTGEFYASGASMAVSKAVFDSLGGFDEKLFLYYDDVDLCWRARLLGNRISAVRTAFCLHSGGRSSQGMPHAKKFYFTQRNRIRVLIKNYSLERIANRLPVAATLILAGAFFLAIKSRSGDYFRSALKAIVWNITALRSTLDERRAIQSRRLIKDLDVEKTMCKASMDLCAFKTHLACRT